MSWDVRPCASQEEVRAATGPIAHYFGRAPLPADQAERILKVLPPDRMHAVCENGRSVGGAGSFPFALTVPGGRVPAAGVAAVGVLPTHRRRGILRALMRAQLERLPRARRAGRLSLGLRGHHLRAFRLRHGVAGRRDRPVARASELSRGLRAARPRADPAVEREAQDLVAPVYERVAAETPGMFARSSAW